MRLRRYALGAKRSAGTELVTGELAQLEITRPCRAPASIINEFPTSPALRCVHLIDLTSTVIARAMAYRLPRLGSLDAIHLATADPFRPDLTEFVTYDHELTEAAVDLGFPVAAPS